VEYPSPNPCRPLALTIQQDLSTNIMILWHDRKPEFEVTGTCDRVKKAYHNIESYIKAQKPRFLQLAVCEKS